MVLKKDHVSTQRNQTLKTGTPHEITNPVAEKPRPYGAKRNADMKDIVTDDMVKNALKSDTVTTTVKTQIKST